ncbi:MAG: hypothetical protein CFE22_14870 [Cytophagaceae bacterium BCCC1]|nr:MAG: hypothetical protein CFE22_14870 [Cytophagaceae bacterium BCCC1]
MELDYIINKPINLVFDYLTDMQKFAAAHPVIHRTEKLSENNYMVFEKLAFISFSYPVTIDFNKKENTILMEAVVMKFTKINMVFSLKSVDNTTIVKETISIKSPFPLQSIIESIFKKQHEKLFRNFGELL